MNEKSVKIEINDLFDELKEQNKTLLNELSFHEKCVQLLQSYRNCLNSFHNNCICDQNIKNESIFNDLQIKYNYIFNRNKDFVEKFNDRNRDKINEKTEEVVNNWSERQKSFETKNGTKVMTINNDLIYSLVNNKPNIISFKINDSQIEYKCLEKEFEDKIEGNVDSNDNQVFHIINQNNKVLNNSELIGINNSKQNESKTNAEFVFGIKIFIKFKVYFEI
jgi:hypothetical protein